MRFRKIFQFELRYQLSRPATWIYFIIVLCFAGLATWSLIDNVRDGDYFLNSPVTIALVTAVASMFVLLMVAETSGNATVRDIKSGMEPLIYTASLRKKDYLGARFLAVWLINLLVLAIIMLLLFTTSQIPVLDAFFISTSFSAYLQAFLLFAVPNSFVITGMVFSLGIISRRAMAGFLGAGLLFFIALITMDIVAGELGKWELGKKLDLSGLTVLKELRMIKSPTEVKFDLVGFDEALIINRLLWIGIGLVSLTATYFKFSFSHATPGGMIRKSRTSAPATAVEGLKLATPITAPVDKRCFTSKDELRQMAYLSWSSFKEMLKRKVWLILVITAGILIIVSEEVLEGQLGVPMISTSWKVLQLLQFPAVGMLLAVLITYYVGELIWRERDSRMNDIVDASPVPDWVLFLSKFTGLLLMLLFLQSLLLITGLIIQFMHGDRIGLWLFVRVLLGFQLIDLVLFAVMAFTIHVLVNQKYVGHLIVVVAFYYMNFYEQIGLQHHLLILGSAPSVSFSEMSGFEPYLGPWLWFKLYWAAWAVLLALVTNLFWFRGKESGFSKRISSVKEGFRGIPAKLVVLSVSLIFILGGFIFYNTNIQNKYLSADERLERRVLYEQLYGKYKDVAQPVLTAVNLEVEIYPDKQEAEIVGTYELVNKNSVPIDTLHIATSSEFKVAELKFSRKAEELHQDNDLGHRIYKLADPLLPGDSLEISFLTIYSQPYFSNHGSGRAVVSNGTYFDFHHMPAIGYQEQREITDKKDREKYTLKPQPAVPSVYDKKARNDISRAEKIHFEAVLGTSDDQTAITAGSLKKSWTKENRRYFHYVTDAPIAHNYEILSAVYEVYETEWRDVRIQIFYHPEHPKNVERMANGVRASLDYFSEIFSPYPHNQIRLVEYPSSGVGLNGNPVTMTYSEGFSFYAPEKDHRELDFPFAIVAHEVGHQWWGNKLRPAYAEGAPLLTESLAWYSAMVLVEHTFGKEHLEGLLRVMRNEYLTPRSSADVPLLQMIDRFSAYRRGPFALHALKEYLGEETVNLALRRLLEKFGSEESPLPVSLDLYAELQQVTPDSLQYLLKDLFEKNTFWELEGGMATASSDGKGNWNVIFEPKAKKITIDEDGVVTEVPINDHLELAVYANSPEGELGELLYLKKHRITSGEQTFNIKVSKEPNLAGIDPNHLLIDRNMYNNFATMKRAKQPSIAKRLTSQE